MSETNIIPIKLQRLVCCQLFHEDVSLTSSSCTCKVMASSNQHILANHDLDLDTLALTYRSYKVVPLELGEIRKTQRRVAALLSNPFDTVKPFSTKPRKRLPDFCYVCSRLNPYRHLFAAEGYTQKCPHVPPAPHPSFAHQKNSPALTDDEDDEFQYSKDDDGLFDTQVLNRRNSYDPNNFSLPPVFSGDLVSARDGRSIVPTVSENTFISSNYKNSQSSDTAATSSSTNGSRRRSNQGHESTSDHLPDIRKGKNLVTSGENDGDLEVGGGRRSGERDEKSRRKKSKEKKSPRTSRSEGQIDYDRDAGLTFRSDPGVSRTMTFDSEKTGGSLRIDEDYVPMSVTIKKLTESDREKSGRSEYEEYEGFLSSSPSGSLGVSRETSLASSGGFGSPSPTSFMNRLRSASWCQCPPLKSAYGDASDRAKGTPCQECRGVGGHEKWCVSAGKMCHSCGKPIKRGKGHAHGERRRRSTREMSDQSGPQPTPSIMITSQASPTHKRSFHDKRKCSLKDVKDGDGSNLKVGDSTAGEMEQRVRFDETVRQVSPDNRTLLPQTALSYDNLVNCDRDLITEVGRENMAAQNQTPDAASLADQEGSALFTKRAKPGTHSQLGRIPRPTVDFHKMAYLLALQDARLYGPTKTKKKGKKGKAMESQSQNGTIFSYFPLLKRPYSDPEKVVPVGLKQDHGRSVKLKNAMKHIFGKVKLGDYYPGGPSWRKM